MEFSEFSRARDVVSGSHDTAIQSSRAKEEYIRFGNAHMENTEGGSRRQHSIKGSQFAQLS